MELLWHPLAREEYLSLQKEDSKTLNKLNKLIKELLRNNDTSQLGKPEILKYSKSQTRYSLRIDNGRIP